MKSTPRPQHAIAFLFLLVFSVIGILAQPSNGVLAVLNKADATLVFIDPVTMKIAGKVPTGDGPHEAVFSADGKTVFVSNYGAQTPGSSLSVIDVATAK